MTDYVTPAQVAKLLATSRNTVHRAIERGDLPAFRYGKLVRIKQTDLDAFLARCSSDGGEAGRRRRLPRR